MFLMIFCLSLRMLSSAICSLKSPFINGLCRGCTILCEEKNTFFVLSFHSKQRIGISWIVKTGIYKDIWIGCFSLPGDALPSVVITLQI